LQSQEQRHSVGRSPAGMTLLSPVCRRYVCLRYACRRHALGISLQSQEQRRLAGRFPAGMTMQHWPSSGVMCLVGQNHELSLACIGDVDATTQLAGQVFAINLQVFIGRKFQDDFLGVPVG